MYTCGEKKKLRIFSIDFSTFDYFVNLSFHVTIFKIKKKTLKMHGKLKLNVP